MTEPTVMCPHCSKPVKLTESLAAPLVEATRQKFRQVLLQKEAEMAGKFKEIETREQVLEKARQNLDLELNEKLKVERTKLMAEESQKAKQAVASEMNQKLKELAELQQQLGQNNLKLAEAQKAQAEFLKKERMLADKEREIDLTIEQKIQEGLGLAREKAKNEAVEEARLKLAEKEKTISDLQKNIEEWKRKAEQGSQQLQGEVQELELEAMLRSRFPFDVVEPVAKGEYGGDAIQFVNNSFGQSCGSILWESKRTKNWSDGWLVKLREDQRSAKADVAIIVSQTLPKEVESFDWIDGVCVAHPRVALPVATILRQGLLEAATARQATEGQQTKTELVYQYLTGPRFKQRVQAIVEAFSTMQEDLASEKKVFIKQWAKREEQIQRVMQSTCGLYGDLQGIAGKSLQEIEGLEMKALED